MEQPADKSGQHIAILSVSRQQLLQPSFSVPLHLRYQPPALDTQYGNAALPHPLSTWIQCQPTTTDTATDFDAADDAAIDSGVVGEWVNVRVEWDEDAMGELLGRVPVGSVSDAPMVYASAAGCSLFGTVILAVVLWMYPVRREVQAEHVE